MDQEVCHYSILCVKLNNISTIFFTLWFMSIHFHHHFRCQWVREWRLLSEWVHQVLQQHRGRLFLHLLWRLLLLFRRRWLHRWALQWPVDTNIRLRREQKPYSKLANSKSAYVSAHVANQESDKRVSHGLNLKKIAFRAAQRLRCIYAQMHDTVCKHTPFNFCYNISLSLSPPQK